MKKIIISAAVVILLAYLFVNKNTGPYSGVYYFKQNPDVILTIKDNNTFIIDNNMGKSSEEIKGKYNVKDNNIVLVPDNEYWKNIITEAFAGKIEGSEIKIATLNDEFIKR